MYYPLRNSFGGKNKKQLVLRPFKLHTLSTFLMCFQFHRQYCHTQLLTFCLLLMNYRQTPIFRRPFFRKVFFSEICFRNPPLKIFGGMSKFGIYVIMKSIYNFNRARALKSYFPPKDNVNAVIQLSLTSSLFFNKQNWYI